MNSEGIITSPVGVDADIAPVLGVPSYDLGYLCSNAHGKTNKYSRKKPVKIEGVDVNLTEPTTWWKGENLQCGLLIPYRTQITACIDDYFDGSMKWGYDAPEPNSKYPARALDFDGYYHYAQNPIATTGFPSTIWLEAGYGEWILRFSLDITTEGTEYNLGLSDIDIRQTTGASESITDWYPGLVFKKTDGSDCFAMSCENTLGTGSFDVEIRGAKERLSGDWYIMPFLSTVQVNTYDGNDVEGHYICADVDPIAVAVRGSDELIYGIALAYWIGEESDKTIGYTAEIKNNSSRDETVEITMYIYSTSDQELTPDLDSNSVNEREESIGTITVPSMTTLTFGSNDQTGLNITFNTITLGRYDSARTYWAGMSVNGNSVVVWHQLEEAIKDASE